MAGVVKKKRILDLPTDHLSGLDKSNNCTWNSKGRKEALEVTTTKLVSLFFRVAQLSKYISPISFNDGPVVQV